MSDSPSLEELKAQLAAAEAIYKAMPKGCGCNARGRAKNKARRDYFLSDIKPLKDQIKALGG
jgi:hypothetical protein